MDACTGGPSQPSQAATSKTTLQAKSQRTQRQLSSKTAADRVTKRLVHSARSSIRQGVPLPLAAAAAASPPASLAAASALKHASASGKLGCPKCRHAVYGCKKCRAAFVKATGVSIPIDRSLHADVFHVLQHQASSTHTTPLSSQKLPTSAITVKSAFQREAGQSTGLALSTHSKGKGVVAVAPFATKGHMGVADGRRASADRGTSSSDRQTSAKRARSEPPVQQPARKKQKAAAPPAATAAVDTGARISGRATPGSRRPQSAASPHVSKAHADTAPPAAAGRSSRLSQTPKAPAAATQAPHSKTSTAGQGSAFKLSTAGKAAGVSGSKPSSSTKAASQALRPSSSSVRQSLSAVKQPQKAVRLSVPAVTAKSAAKHQCPPASAAKLRVAALPKQAAPTAKQAQKPIAVLMKPQRRAGPSPSLMKASASGPGHALPKQAAAKAPAVSKAKTVAAPKAMPAAKLRQTPSSIAAATAGSILVQGLDSSLGCSKCRFMATGCKRCRAKQAGQLSLGTNT